MAIIATPLPKVPPGIPASTCASLADSIADVVPLAGLVALTLGAQPHLLAADTLVGLDSASQYLPWYAFMGKSLMAGHIPGWNPATFSGTPFIANPLSGWTYVPAMALFWLLPLAQAAKSYLVFHPLLAGWSTYALARVLGQPRLGAFVAGLAYANSGFLQIQNSCCFAFASVYAWLPLTLLGTERALRATRSSTRAAWWGLAGFGVSQIVAAWLGQGTYYSALLVGGYIVYRTVFISPSDGPTGMRVRIVRLLQHEAGVFLLGASLAAAGLLPRVEFISLSNLAGGYMQETGRVGGLRPEQWLFLATPGMWYVGASVLVLAAVAPFLVRGCLRDPVWYFGATSLIALVLTDTFETPVDWLLFHILPGFASLHPHAPERILTVAYLGPALLAGATFSVAHNRGWWMRQLGGFVTLRRVLTASVVVVVAADLAVGGARARSDRTFKDPLDSIAALTPVDLSTYYLPTGAAAFLQEHMMDSPARYFGYAPDVAGHPLAYTMRFLDPGIADLEVNNHALPLGLQDIQGYDASHLRRYDAFLEALNGQTQNYHDADVFPSGLGSPLLDLLGARYVIAPAHSDAVDATALERFPNTIYADGRVEIRENPSAFPRAWIVHQATQLPGGSDTGLLSIASGQIDARQTALLEVDPPPLEIPADATLDEAAVTDSSADRLDVQTSTRSTGLLLLSEVYYPAWKAYVDDQPADLYVADGALRAVRIPPGEHSIELRFESDTLKVGLLISCAAVLLLTLVVILSLQEFLRTERNTRCAQIVRGRRGRRCSSAVHWLPCVRTRNPRSVK